jgi:Niemann-Pick C1 protein
VRVLQEKKSFFGGALPVVYNGPAEAPAADTRKQLVELCGAKWSEGNVCCDAAQVNICPPNRDFN